MSSPSLIQQIHATWLADDAAVRLRVLDAAGEPVLAASGADLIDFAGRHAAGLAAHGVGPGDRVVFVLPTGPAFIGALFGTLWLGAAAVPLAPPVPRVPVELEWQRLRRAIAKADARLVVVDIDTLDGLPDLGTDVVRAADLLGHGRLDRPADPPGPFSVIQFSSGSTGHPKGVGLTDAAILANLAAIHGIVGQRPDDVVVSWLPLHHDMGLFSSLCWTQLYGVPSVILPPEAFVADPAIWLRVFTRYGGSMTAAPNVAYQLCARLSDRRLAGIDLSTWRVAMVGAEPVRPATLLAFAERMAPLGFRATALLPTYGLAEATLAVAARPIDSPIKVERVRRDRYRQGIAELVDPEAQGDDIVELPSVGGPVAGTELSIRDESGSPLPERHVGEIWVKSPSLMTGYVNDEAATAAALTADGWLRTGDLGYLSGGDLIVSGRLKDLIIRSGVKYHPEDLEPIIERHPAIRPGGTAVVSLEDAGREKVVLLAEIRPAAATDAADGDLSQALRQQVHAETGLRLDEVVLLQPQQLPKTTSGKIRRRVAARLFQTGALVRAHG